MCWVASHTKSDAGTRGIAIPPHLVAWIKQHLKVHLPAARAVADRPDLRWRDLRYTGEVLAASTGATLAELVGRIGQSRLARE